MEHVCARVAKTQYDGSSGRRTPSVSAVYVVVAKGMCVWVCGLQDTQILASTSTSRCYSSGRSLSHGEVRGVPCCGLHTLKPRRHFYYLPVTYPVRRSLRCKHRQYAGADFWGVWRERLGGRLKGRSRGSWRSMLCTPAPSRTLSELSYAASGHAT